MKVDDQLISKLENLARLRLTEEERESLAGELDKIIDMFSLIAEVNTDNVAPLRHMNEVYNVLRNDEPIQNLHMDDVKDNAPKIINNLFAVPKVIE
ncbi:MAG TPA: Asp-tRNA(Asn)/Glu-tRNA(Gln) amidotransferase subunit GatC [Saprospiraceae bacterium]|nr:Asp-tRNA(Asn)/Glu-tRNA(Gln) amidotransferase subunit GatC [Saprospiraceae bacterium]HPN70791.1 Asp-tRNA(Asn)/Glu-tRNA(Gln) amidotransferase subunit GatC [Saprospiraceae bacterium]